ncbi:hypothetical protein Krac_10624 [Ktedonobacter racemifer DSM 44963]|uniref:Uncharacterized protein n=1 Tax=Ktedonobacter racemifer DSM 44963 TaxID=485913 RepID=D6TI38_KTERA|nr:hypothetical protein Krac_10624 [Ktedonobacter racemifer DSM 44963]
MCQLPKSCRVHAGMDSERSDLRASHAHAKHGSSNLLTMQNGHLSPSHDM